MEDETPGPLAKLKAKHDRKNFREATKDEGIVRAEEFHQRCLIFCRNIYDTVAEFWSGKFNEGDGRVPEVSSASAVLSIIRSCSRAGWAISPKPLNGLT